MRHMGHKQKYEARTVWTICMLYFWECTYSLLHMVTWPTSSNSVNGRWTSSSLWLWTRFIFSVFFLSVVMTLFLFLFCFFFLFSFFLQTLYRMFSKVDFQSGFRPYHCSIYSWYIFWVEFAPACDFHGQFFIGSCLNYFFSMQTMANGTFLLHIRLICDREMQLLVMLPVTNMLLFEIDTVTLLQICSKYTYRVGNSLP